MSHPEKLPSLILTLHKDHGPLALLTAQLCCHTGQMSGAGWQGWGLRGEKARETRVPRTCLVSSKQGVNAGPSPHTGVTGTDGCQGGNTGNFHSLGRKRALGERIVSH